MTTGGREAQLTKKAMANSDVLVWAVLRPARFCVRVCALVRTDRCGVAPASRKFVAGAFDVAGGSRVAFAPRRLAPLYSSWLGYSALTRATRVRVLVAEFPQARLAAPIFFFIFFFFFFFNPL